MPIEILELDEGLGNVIIGEGFLSSKEYYNSLTEHLSKPDKQLHKYIYSILDFTQVTNYQIKLTDIHKIATQSIHVSKINPHVIVGIAASSSINFGIARIWASLASTTGWTIKVFRNRNDLDLWIQQKIKKQYGEIDLKFDK